MIETAMLMRSCGSSIRSRPISFRKRHLGRKSGRTSATRSNLQITKLASTTFLFTAITDELNQVFVYTPADGSRITWINESTLKHWGVSREQVIQQAEENMAAIVADTKLEVEEIAGNKLGMISTDEVAFKASLILSPAFRDLVLPTHGWPVYVVVPCRDFAYVVRHDNREFLGRLGRVVVKEYRNSGHPITKDVLEVSDNGISAIGTYPD